MSNDSTELEVTADKVAYQVVASFVIGGWSRIVPEAELLSAIKEATELSPIGEVTVRLYRVFRVANHPVISIERLFVGSDEVDLGKP